MQGINFPKVIFGTSGLGNLYIALSEEVKYAIVAESVRCSKPAVFDSAGKYVAQNVAEGSLKIPMEFWREMK